MTDILQAARSYYGLADTESCTTQLFTNQAGQTCVAFEIPLSNEDFAAIVQRMQNMQQPDTQPDTAIIEGPTVEAMREAYNALSKAEKGRYGSFARYMTQASEGIVTVLHYDGWDFFDSKEIREGELVWEYRRRCEEETIPLEMDYARFECMVEMGQDIRRKVDEIKPEPPLPTTHRQVVHVDAPEEPEPVSMDAVWIPATQCTDAQLLYASDMTPRLVDGTGAQYLIQWAMLTDEQKQKAKESKQ